MIKVSVLYPNRAGCRFDFNYYCSSHIPMVRDKLGSACRGIAVDQGMAGEGGAPAPYIAMAHLYFDSVEAFEGAFGPNAEAILADIPNYTDLSPAIQIGNVMINARRSDTGPLHTHFGIA